MTGMVDFAQARRTMVDNQVRPSDVTDLRLIAALLEVARETFVPPGRRAIAYLDVDLPVSESGAPRALLKPMVFARLAQAAGIGETERVLDVGCASGYSSAVLARLAGTVVALEEDADLARTAAQMLRGAANVTAVSGALAEGWPKDAPYDVILLEGACEIVPESLLSQLADGGRLLAVVGRAPGKATLYRKDAGNVSAVVLFDAAAPALPGFARPPAFVF
jgi:protein-L-isoaspartate(D-aspartate) O-methyltransferase